MDDHFDEHYDHPPTDEELARQKMGLMRGVPQHRETTSTEAGL